MKKTKSRPTLKPAPPQPDLDATLQRAIALHQGGELQAAARLYLDIIEQQPDHFDALHLLGVFALQSNDYQAAYDLIRRSLEVDPRQAPAQANLGVVLQKLQRHDEALAAYREALRLDPNNLSALNNFGNALQESKRYGESLALFERALKIDPDYPEALNNMANALIELRRCEEALLCLGRVLELRPALVAAWFNRGNALQYLNRIDAALASYRQALALEPAHVDANFNAGVCHLLGGDFEAGWPLYDWRWKKEAYGAARQLFGQPAWSGRESLRGKTILVHAEQGFGDTLQFCRFVRPLADLGASVILRVQPALKTLLADLGGARRVLAEGEPLPEYDFHCPLMSLGRAVGASAASIPAAQAYLHSDAVRTGVWAARLGSKSKPRIGMVWSGNGSHANDRQRSIALVDFIGLVSPAAQFVSLQKELRPVDLLALRQRPEIAHFGERQTDFAETAALLANLDLVITVDTSVAHLAGALGKPVWILLPFAPDWRWMLEREDSPWYASARLFRQTRAGDWAGVLARVAAELERFTG